MDQTTRYRNSLTSLLTLAGVAIGLGNVWRFPYMMGQNGGSAFLLLYLGIMLLIAIPALTAEWALARHTRRGTAGTFDRIFAAPWGRAIGALLVFGTFMALTYYTVVIGNVTYTAAFSIVHGFSEATSSRYQAGLGNGLAQYGFALTVIAWAGYVTHRGLNAGIEASSRLFVPAFGIVVVYLVIHTLTIDGAAAALGEFLKPDFSRIGIREVFAAMGQACFSVGIGGTLMLVYGSYLADGERLLGKATLTGLTDAGAALLAGAFIVPAVLVFGIELNAGPGLVFATLPELFATMPGGRLAGSLFLAALTLMAFLSAVAAMQVCVRGLHFLTGEQFSRGTIIFAVVLIVAMLMLPPSLRPGMIGTLDLIFGSGFLLFGCALAVLGLAWVADRAILDQQVGAQASWLRPWLRVPVPLALLSVLGLYVYDIVAGGGGH
ncbi:MAG: sodium-dependent transporter [Pseudomonadota bacterium]